MSSEIRVPTLGESVTEATIAKWMKAPGEAVAAEEIICELETDKVSVEIPAPAAGVLSEIVAEEGATVEVNALLAIFEEGGTGGGSGGSDKDAPAKAADIAHKTEEVAPQTETAGGGMIDVKVPVLGESVTEATVGEYLKQPGAAVAADEILVELETDKVAIEVPSPVAGVIEEIVSASGETVGLDAVLVRIKEGAGASAPPKKEEPAKEEAPAPAAKGSAKSKSEVLAEAAKGVSAKAEPVSVAPVSAAPAQAPRAPVSAEDAAREERVKMTRLRQTIARRLKDAQNTAAMLTTYNEVDMGGIMDLRNEYKDQFLKKHGVKLGFMSFFAKACIHALHEVPDVNAEIDGTDVVYKNFAHLGIAVGTPTGLVVPVLRNAQDMSFASIEKGIAELGAKARDGKLSMADMQGGTFTISNGGVYGSLMSSPILNPPQSGILGMHKIQDRPMVVGGEIVIRPMMYLALSYDHRIVDGKGAVTFLVRVKEALEDPRRLLMDL